MYAFELVTFFFVFVLTTWVIFCVDSMGNTFYHCHWLDPVR